MFYNWRSRTIHDKIQIRVFEVFFIGEIVAETKIKSPEEEEGKENLLGRLWDYLGKKIHCLKFALHRCKKKAGEVTH